MRPAPFGSPAAINSETVERLPLAMQVEAVLLLREMGCGAMEVSMRTGGRAEMREPLRPFRHLTEYQHVGEGGGDA